MLHENMSLLTGACQVPTLVSFQGALFVSCARLLALSLGIWDQKSGIH